MNVDFIRPFRHLRAYANLITKEPADVFIFARNGLNINSNAFIFKKIFQTMNTIKQGKKFPFRNKYTMVTNIPTTHKESKPDIYHFTAVYRVDKLEHLSTYTISEAGLKEKFDVQGGFSKISNTSTKKLISGHFGEILR